MFLDVYFQLEDGHCCAHKPILMARCDVMAAMFRGDFRESSAKVVSFSLNFFYLLVIAYYLEILLTGVVNCIILFSTSKKIF